LKILMRSCLLILFSWLFLFLVFDFILLPRRTFLSIGFSIMNRLFIELTSDTLTWIFLKITRLDFAVKFSQNFVYCHRNRALLKRVFVRFGPFQILLLKFVAFKNFDSLVSFLGSNSFNLWNKFFFQAIFMVDSSCKSKKSTNTRQLRVHKQGKPVICI
jgi:hypothetical protein